MTPFNFQKVKSKLAEMRDPQLGARLAEAERGGARTRELRSSPRMHVVRLLAPQLDRDSHTKDIDFSRSGIMQRWQGGYVYKGRPCPGTDGR
jgi:hypothetical protein